MRGRPGNQQELYSYVPLEQRIPADHELRAIRKLADGALQRMSRLLGRQYSAIGRPSIPPEYLIKASLLQLLYGIRSEIQLMQQLDYNLLYRWFVGLGVDEPVWTPEVFSMNRIRLFSTEIAMRFFEEILADAEKEGLLSSDHFSVDGTTLRAWASQKSFRPKKEPPGKRGSGEDFHGEKRSNQTHASKTDPESRLFRKSSQAAAELSYMGHVLMENRSGLIVDAEMTTADTRQEREAVIRMLKRRPGKRRITVGGDKGYDVNDFHLRCRAINVTPHIAQRDDNRATVLDRRTTRHRGYLISAWKRKLIEQSFGWLKSAAGLRQVKMRGLKRNNPQFLLTLAVYNMVKIRNLTADTT